MNKLSLSLVCLLLAGCDGDGAVSSSGDGLVTGTGGSTAKMTISGDYLYAISGSSVQLFDISAPESPAPWTKVQIDWNIQTLFPYGDYLLVGAADGIHILDNTDPASPTYVGDFQHARAVDPVVAQGNVAYVTLRRDSTQPGPGIENQMNIIDISDVTQPVLLDTISMQAPEGLAVQGDRLHVCDGVAGLKSFDLTDPVRPVVAEVIPEVNCRDVIASGDILYVIEDDGLSQYDISAEVPQLRSHIERKPVLYIVN